MLNKPSKERGFTVNTGPTSDDENQKFEDLSHKFLGLAVGSLRVSVVAPNQASEIGPTGFHTIQYMKHGLVQCITGKSARTVQRLAKEIKTVRLNYQQSTVASQYGQVLEHAIIVFGSQQVAENWLKKPCRYLCGNIPLELIDNPLGFQVVEDYLTRIEHGVYP